MNLDNKIVYKLLNHHNQTNADKKSAFNLTSFESSISSYAKTHPSDAQKYDLKYSNLGILATQEHSLEYNKFVVENLIKFGYADTFQAYEIMQNVFAQIGQDNELVNKLSTKQVSQAFTLMQKLLNNIKFQSKLSSHLNNVNQLDHVNLSMNDMFASSMNEFYKTSDLKKLKLPLKPLTFDKAEQLFKPNADKLI